MDGFLENVKVPIYAHIIHEDGLELSDKEKDKLYKKIAGKENLKEFKVCLQEALDRYDEEEFDPWYNEDCDDGIVPWCVKNTGCEFELILNDLEEIILSDGTITLGGLAALRAIMNAYKEDESDDEWERRYILFAEFFEKVINSAKKIDFKVVKK